MALSHEAVLDEHRQFLASSLVPDEAWTAPWEDLADFPIFGASKGVVIGDDEWMVPKSFVNPNYHHEHDRRIDFTKALPEGWSRDEIRSENLVRRLKRIAFLDFTQTVPGTRSILTPPAPRNWVKNTAILLKAAQSAVILTDRVLQKGTTCPDPGPIFAELSPEAFGELRNKQPRFFQYCIPRLNGLFNTNLFDDWPAGDIKAVKPKTKPIRRFSDDAFGEILKTAHFLADIQADLETCYAEISLIECDEQGRREKKYALLYRSQRIAEWSGRKLYPGLAFPYIFEISGKGKKNKPFSAWPVDTLHGVKSLLWICQAANGIILNTATGGRISEMKTLGRDPLVKINGTENLTGHTFKESEDPRGTARHWPLPDLAVQAIERQQSLHETLGYQGEWLWVPGENSKTGITNLDQLLPTFGKKVKTLAGVPLGEIDGGISSHRFRYTMSRLVGLALEGASEVLYTVLGHKDRNTTMGYMLSDPEFRSDAERVGEEVRHVRRQRLIADADNNGGPAAATVRIAKAEISKKAARLGIDNAVDENTLKAILPQVDKVQKDIYCTGDPAKQEGLCSKVSGMRDVGECTPSCIFRLEAAAAEQVHRQTIEMFMRQLGGNRIYKGTRSYHQANIVGHLASFEKTLDSFVSDDRLRDALRGLDRRYIERLPVPTRDKLIAYLENDQ